MTQPIYNTIGKQYNSTRNADAYIAGRLYALLHPQKDGRYFDIGCGTGNYTRALTDMGLQLTGIEPSDVMITKAKANHPDIQFIQSNVEALPFENNSFDGGMGTFTIHHWDDVQKGLKEINRILKPGSRFVLLSFTPDQLMNYWLSHYFPNTMKKSAEAVERSDKMMDLFKSCGFAEVDTEKYFVHEGLTDYFLYANKYHPAAYLDPQIRNGASSFTLYADEAEVKRGLLQLEQDISNGSIQDIINRYENDLGDYLFYCATKA